MYARARTVYIGNLPFCTGDQVVELFREAGPIASVRVHDGNLICASVEYGVPEHAELAERKLNGRFFRGQVLRVSRNPVPDPVPVDADVFDPMRVIEVDERGHAAPASIHVLRPEHNALLARVERIEQALRRVGQI